MAITVPADRRFRRTETRPVRRTRLRTRWWWQLLRSLVIISGLAAGGYQAAVFATTASALRVQNLSVDGNRRLSAGEVSALLEGLKGENLLTADLERWRERLLASSWVADAELRRRLPGTVDVVVTEREPIGIARWRDNLYLVDVAGGVIDEFGPRYADCDLPLIDGLLVSGAAGSLVDQARGRLVAELMADIRRRPDLARRVSQIDVSNPFDVHVILDGDPAVIRLGTTRFLERIWGYVELQAALRQRVPAIDYVDLRFDDRIYVGPSALPAAVETAGEAGGGPAGTGGAPGAAPAPAGRQ
jgi:cell division septal protein FtsQ